jgi:regulator of sirC expression with transglutaminase-like and TPR domain
MLASRTLAVLATSAGSPALLALIYLLVAQRLGLRAQPLLLPSHTFVLVHTAGSPLLVDPFNGGQVCSLSVVQARLNANWGFSSPRLHLDEQLPALLAEPRCTGARQLLCRLLANLREAYWAPLPKSGGLRGHVLACGAMC